MSDPEEYEAHLRRRVQRARSSPWKRFKRRWKRRLRRHRVLAVLSVAVLVIVALSVTTWLVWNGRTSAAADTSPPPPSSSTSESITGAPDNTLLGGGATLEGVRAEIASDQPLVISVLGDSTGNEQSEWVYLWSQHLAKTRAVTYHLWDDVHRRYLPARVLSTSGPVTDVWNMSAPGRQADYPAKSIRAMQPVRPDLVIYNFGHNNTAEDFGDAIYSSLTAVSDRWGAPVPSVAILQNPETGSTADKHAATVAELYDDIAPAFGMPTVDVWGAFMEGVLPDLVSNADGLGVHPTAEGSRVWAQRVVDALG